MTDPHSGPRAAAHPESVRRRLTAEDPGLPLITYYEPESGARVELSRATFDNWVAKAAGLLAEEADVVGGSRVGLQLQLHWLLPVWCWAAWSLGATVVLPDDGAETGEIDVMITDRRTAPAAGVVLASSRDPLGLALGPQTPTGMVDALADIRGYPDFRQDPVPPDDVPLVVDAKGAFGCGPELQAAVAGVPPGCRAALLRRAPKGAAALVEALVGPLTRGGALVLADGSTSDLAAIRAQERVDVDLD